MNPAPGWKKVPLSDVLENKEIDDQFATLFRERKFARLPRLLEVHIKKRKNLARYIFENTLFDKTSPLLIYTDREAKEVVSPVSVISIFADKDELGKTTLLLQEMEAPPNPKPLSFIGFTKEAKGKEEERVMVDKNEVGAVKHEITVMIAHDRVYLDKWTVQAMNECEIALQRDESIPQLVSYIMMQPNFDSKAKEGHEDLAKATCDFNVYLKKN
jgi:hypothetical protein